jgi:hypothetical protein
MRITRRHLWKYTDWLWIGLILGLLCRLLYSCSTQSVVPDPGCPGSYRVRLHDKSWIITDDTTLKGGQRP